MNTDWKEDIARLRRARSRILRWYRDRRRDLPWRRTDDPYAIWIAEVMLQQTRVDTVIPYYEKFLQRFPTVAALARAEEEEVLAAWSGLGYYRRARFLRAAAAVVRERYGGVVPRDPLELRSLPGVGRYTAGAIASISFGLREAVVDGNVERVLGRWLARNTPPGNRRTRELWSVAEALLPEGQTADWNQALMELGATVCTPRSPDCLACPAKTVCEARRSGRPESFPPSKPATTITTLPVAVAIFRHAGRVLLERHCAETPLRGSWDLPAREIPEGTDPSRWLQTTFRKELSTRLGRPVLASRATHSILTRRLLLEAWRFDLRSAVRTDPRWRWVEPRHLDGVAVSGATSKILKAAGLAIHGRSHGGTQSAASGSLPAKPSGSRGRRKA